jgi:hypothetical protein
MTTTTAETTAPSRTPLLAAFGIAASAVLTAIGTFWDVNGNDRGDHNASDWYVCLGIIAVAAALVYGLVVRTAATGNPGRRALILGIVAVPSVVVFWSGIPMVLVSAAVACALLEKDKVGSYGTGSKVAFVLSALATAGAVTLAFTG